MYFEFMAGSDSESSDSGSESDPEKEVSQFSSALFMPVSATL